MIHILINDFYFGIKKMILTIKTRIEPINVIKNHININININNNINNINKNNNVFNNNNINN